MTLTQGYISMVKVTHTLNHVPAINPHCNDNLDIISHNHIMTFTLGHIAKVKVTVYTWQFFFCPITFQR